MKLGPLEINWKGFKSWSQLDAVIARHKSGLHGDPKTNPIKQLAEYKSWVSSCAGLISDKVSTTPFSFYRTDTGEEITSRLHSYRTFTKPFMKPNNLMSFRFIKSWCQIQLDLCGMSMIYKARNRLGQIWELWPLNMNDLVGIFPNLQRPNKLLPETEYVFSIDGELFSFTPSELIMLIYPHPKYLDRGASVIQQQAYTVDIQTYVEVYERDFFANSARVDMVLQTDQDLDEPKANALKERWISKFRNKFHDIAVLSSGLKPIPLEWTNKDFEFLHLAQWSRDMILAAYRVPPSKLGMSGDSNRANSVNAEINFSQDCIQPRLTLWDEELTKEILNEFDPRIEIKHDNPLPRDRQIETSEARIYLAGAPCLTINEVREDKKKTKDPNGDRILISRNYIPLDRLDEFLDAELESKKNNPFGNQSTLLQQTDPGRHENDTPHVNPDGSDNRDNLPTDGRSLVDFESKLREVWFEYLITNIKTIKTYLEFRNLFYQVIKGSVICSLNHLHPNEKIGIFDHDWVIPFSRDLSIQFFNTGFQTDLSGKDYSEFCEKQMNENPRIAKICNFGILASINYSNYLVGEQKGLKKKWVITRNECGHRGRVKDFSPEGKFLIHKKEMRFPGEYINLNCSCILELE